MPVQPINFAKSAADTIEFWRRQPFDRTEDTSRLLEGNLIAAQVHATLALAEQQRIANLIALGKTEERYWVEPDREAGETGYYATRIRPDIEKGLGL